MKREYRHTKIIFTIGPATESEAMLEKLICEGVDVCRINMAHANHEWTANIVKRVREVSKRVSREIAIMMDIKGPEIRTCALDKPIQLETGGRIDLCVESNQVPEGASEYPVIGVNYPQLHEDLFVGGEVLVDNGLLKFEVIGKTDTTVQCRIIIGGTLSSRRHINLPGVHVKLPAITEKDKGDIKVAIENDIDIIALSFAREATDIDILREFLIRNNSDAKIVAKIEDQSAITNLEEIIQASDGLMIARGDLGIECPFDELPVIQRRAIKKCLELGKPVTVATHMLESMIENPVPTRAEVTDVSNAVYEQADCIMLSGETTVGKYPVECVQVFKRIAMRTEEAPGAGFADGRELKGPKTTMLRHAKGLAEELGNTPILVFTRTGRLGEILASLRCKVPVFAFTDRSKVLKHLVTLRGIEPFHMEFNDDPEQTIRDGFKILLSRGWVERGQSLVVITNALAHDRIIDTVQLRYAE